MSKLSDKIPSFLWIFIIIGGIALFIGAIFGGFWAVTHVEGVGSVIILILGWLALRSGSKTEKSENSSLGIAVGIVFFAIIALGLDQPGNFIYNQPLKWIFCPTETDLLREAVERGARGGGVSVSQNFTCVSPNNGQILRTISMFELLAVRFFEYVLIGYLLLGLSKIYTQIKSKIFKSN